MAFNPDFQYNGELYTDRGTQYRQTKHTSDHMYSDDIGELNCLLDGLVRAGNVPASAQKIDPKAHAALGQGVAIPDFDVLLKTGRQVFVEVTIAGTQQTIKTEQTIRDMSAGLMQWSTSDKAAQAALGGHPLSFVPQNSIAGKDEKTAMEEMKKFVANEKLEQYSGSYHKIASKAYPILSKAGTLVMLHNQVLQVSYAQISTPSTSYSPTEEYVSVLSAIKHKIINGYDQFRPIWLVVGIAHVIEPWQEVFAATRSSLRELGPFERIFVANSNHSLRATWFTFRDSV